MKRRKPGRKPKKESRWGFRGMTVRNWLELLIVPLTLAVIGFLFTMQQNARQQAIEDQRLQQAQEIEDQRAEANRALQKQSAQDEALQSYLSQMTSLLLDKGLRTTEPGSEVRILARARTLAMLAGLDARRKTEIMRFMEEAALVQRVDGRDPIITLNGADLEGVNLGDPSPYLVVRSNLKVDLSGADLGLADLRKAYLLGVDLTNANLKGANLNEADLRSVRLSDADLREATLRDANLSDANLSGADLGPPGASPILANANLRGADLSDADLRYNDLSRANLSGADLSGTNLKGVILNEADLRKAHGITKEQLEQQASSLEDTIMPDGSKHD